MRKPKPPTTRSVSATLRAANFRVAAWTYTGPLKRIEGYRVRSYREVAICVEYLIPIPGSSAEITEASARRNDALAKMTDVLRRKGWLVRDEGTYLMVSEV